MIRFLLPAFILWNCALSGQDTLNYPQFLQLLANHPAMQQAAIRSEMGEAAVQQARGGFDPVIQSGFNTKTAEGTTYYDLRQANLQLPTASPLRFMGGLERNSGDYLNPQAYTPDGGQWYAGLGFPLLQGLMTDARRTALNQALAYRSFTGAESDRYRLSLWFEASKAYADWWNAWERVEVSRELIALSEQRLEAVNMRAEAGDLPRIDTVEAVMQLRQRQQQLAEQAAREANTRMHLNNFLWQRPGQDANIPVELMPGTRPSAQPLTAPIWEQPELTPGAWDTLSIQSPVLRQMEAEIAGMDADLKWKKEQRKPQLDITLYSLGYLGSDDGPSIPDDSNLMAGFQFRYPLLNRSARGASRLQELRVEDKKLEMELVSTRLLNNARGLQENIRQMENQLALNLENVTALRILVEGEKEKFANGESSLFLVNQREMAYMEARVRLADLYAGLFKTQCELQFTMGLLP
ncbi:MAG: TolC family protein [Flavobacteriales bacterium]|nr:TolC family protein [Flavobacteriales bacterium]